MSMDQYEKPIAKNIPLPDEGVIEAACKATTNAKQTNMKKCAISQQNTIQKTPNVTHHEMNGE